MQFDPSDNGARSAQASRARARRHWLHDFLCAVNAVGIAGYLWGASYAWADPAERAAGITTLTSEPLIWGMWVLPIWGAFLLINLAWLVVTIARQWRLSGPVVLLVSAAWIAAAVVDFAHH